LLVVGSDGTLLAVSPPDYLGTDRVGILLDPQAIPGLSDPLQAALAGEKDAQQLYSIVKPDKNVVLTMPVWDEAEDQVLGVLVASAAIPTVASYLGDLLQLLGISLLVITLIAGLIGTAFGFLTARGLVQRLNQLAEASLAWSQGDFSVLVDAPSGDELGQLAHRLNQMAQELENLLETRSELVVVEERNRLARDLHDSAKQQAFAASAQISAARQLIKTDPDAAEACIAEAERLTYDLRKELTYLIQELRPVALQGKGLASAVRAYAADWSRSNAIEGEVRVQLERPIPLEIEQNVYRIVQEALANVARHSEANVVEIELVYTKHAITCSIQDDGIGFEQEKGNNGFGLLSMKERVHALGGEWSIESAVGSGTSVSFTIPFEGLLESEENQDG